MNKLAIAYRNRKSWFAFSEVTWKRIQQGFTKNWQVFVVKDYLNGMIFVNEISKNIPFPEGNYCPWNKILDGGAMT